MGSMNDLKNIKMAIPSLERQTGRYHQKIERRPQATPPSTHAHNLLINYVSQDFILLFTWDVLGRYSLMSILSRCCYLFGVIAMWRLVYLFTVVTGRCLSVIVLSKCFVFMICVFPLSSVFKIVSSLCWFDDQINALIQRECICINSLAMHVSFLRAIHSVTLTWSSWYAPSNLENTSD